MYVSFPLDGRIVRSRDVKRLSPEKAELDLIRSIDFSNLFFLSKWMGFWPEGVLTETAKGNTRLAFLSLQMIAREENFWNSPTYFDR